VDSEIAMAGIKGVSTMTAEPQHYDDVLPDPGFEITPGNTAVVITDPQVDFLSENGVTWHIVGPSVTKNGTVANLKKLIEAAHASGIPVFVSPHYYYPTDHGWKFSGALETMMHAINMFDRKGALTIEGFEGSGADWEATLKPLIEHDNVVIASPHKVFSPKTNDLSLQLRKRGIDKIILAGMSANLCVEAHMRDLIEDGFEIAIAKDATAGAILPKGDSYEAALLNFRMIASSVQTTDELVSQMQA
jgi:nicotinamidase-related amidase